MSPCPHNNRVAGENVGIFELSELWAFLLSPVCENKYQSTTNSKSNEGTQEKNVGVKGTNMNAEELDRESLVRSRLLWAGHVERMTDERLPKRAAELREQSRRRLGRSILRWEDRVKRDVRKAGE